MRALLQARQNQSKAELDVHRRDVQFAVGRGAARHGTYAAPLTVAAFRVPAMDGPLQGTCTPGAQNVSPRDYCEAATWCACDASEFNVERLRPYHSRRGPRARRPRSGWPAGGRRRVRRSGPASAFQVPWRGRVTVPAGGPGPDSEPGAAASRADASDLLSNWRPHSGWLCPGP